MDGRIDKTHIQHCLVYEGADKKEENAFLF